MVSGNIEPFNFLSIQPLSRCFNGGRCSDGVDSFSCVCEDGFSGEYCECTDAPEEGGDVTCLNVTAQVSYTLPPNFDDILLATTTTTQVKLEGKLYKKALSENRIREEKDIFLRCNKLYIILINIDWKHFICTLLVAGRNYPRVVCWFECFVNLCWLWKHLFLKDCVKV